MKKTPLISVVLSVYNGERFIARAIASVLIQDYKNFEFIIVDDASTDSTATIINSFNDPRIRLVSLAKNEGVANALNHALTMVHGTYIAKMDADDISLPTRFKTQVTWLEKHPDIDCVGTGYGVISESGNLLKLGGVLTSHKDIVREMHFRNSFVHGSLMIRRKFIVDNNFSYPKNARYNEDYTLLLKMKEKGMLSNIPKVLYLWRANTQGLTATNRRQMAQNAQELMTREKTSPNQWSIAEIVEKFTAYKNNTCRFNGQQYSQALSRNYHYFVVKQSIIFLSHKKYDAFLQGVFAALLVNPSGFLYLLLAHLSFLLQRDDYFSKSTI